MAFCMNCGKQLPDGAKFCLECGTKVESTKISVDDTSDVPINKPTTFSERKQEYAGKIIKCPTCGAELSSFAAICPDCGHEINSQNVSPYIREFSKAIDKYDRAIAHDPEPPKTGWKTWSKNKRIIWVVINIFTSFIPWVIYLVFPLIKPFFFGKSTPVLSTSEKQKAALIENATFPNEREATIEALMFTKSKMAFLASERFNRKTQYWTNLWNTKAIQLHQRAGIILKGDKIVEAAYTDIVASKSKVDKHVKTRAIIGVIIIVAYLSFVAINGSLLGGISNIFQGFEFPTLSLPQSGNDKAESTDSSFEWLDTGLSTKIPAINATNGKYVTNSDIELDVTIEAIAYSQFEEYVTACKNLGYTIDASKDTNKYTAYNEEGYYIDLMYWEYNSQLDINLLAPLSGDENFVWPTGDIVDVIPKTEFSSGKVGYINSEEAQIYLYDFTKDDFDVYVEQCKSAGFTIDSKVNSAKTWYVYEAYNSDGYKIRICVDNMKELSIIMRIPKKKDEFSWPTTGPATMLPKPDNCIGEISIDFDWSFSVYISDMTIDEADDYIDKCISMGFEKDSRWEGYFSGNMGKDIQLRIDYVGFNTVYISITDYDELGG